jgi:uncharacterized protein (DUF697 family)
MSDLLHAAHLLGHTIKEIHEINEKEFGDEVAKIVNTSAIGATVSGLASAWVPGLGGTIATGICIGFVWRMYLAINKKVGLSLQDNIVKTIASGILTNLAAAIVGSIVLSTVLSFIPGLGNISASIIMGGVCYAITLVSGIVYIKILTNIFERKQKQDVSAEEIQQEYDSMDKDEIKEMLKQQIKEGKKIAKKNKK